MGHGHDLGEKAKIPDYRIYKVEDVPELTKLRDILAEKGLKDPWLRNEVWRYDHKEWGTPRSRWMFLTRGMKYGFIAALLTVAVDKGMDYLSGGDDHEHGHH